MPFLSDLDVARRIFNEDLCIEIFNPSTAGFTQDYFQYLTSLFVNYGTGQEFTKVLSNNNLWGSASSHNDYGNVWLLSN